MVEVNDEDSGYEIIRDGWGKEAWLKKLPRKNHTIPKNPVLAKSKPPKIKLPPPVRPVVKRDYKRHGNFKSRDIKIAKCPLCRRRYGYLAVTDEERAFPEDKMITRVCGDHGEVERCQQTIVAPSVDSNGGNLHSPQSKDEP